MSDGSKGSSAPGACQADARSEEQKHLLEQWDLLGTANKHILMELTRSLKEE